MLVMWMTTTETRMMMTKTMMMMMMDEEEEDGDDDGKVRKEVICLSRSPSPVFGLPPYSSVQNIKPGETYFDFNYSVLFKLNYDVYLINQTIIIACRVFFANRVQSCFLDAIASSSS